MCQGVRQYHDMSTCWHRVRLRISNSKRLLARTRVAIQGVSCVCMCAVCAHTKPALCVRGLLEYGMVLRYQVRPTLSKHEPHDVTWVRECTCCVGGACLALVPSLASKKQVLANYFATIAKYSAYFLVYHRLNNNNKHTRRPLLSRLRFT